MGLRREQNVTKEIKYKHCKNPSTLAFCKRLVDLFMEDSAYFRCAVVDQHGFDYSGFGRSEEEPKAIKQARAYKKFAEMLLAPNVEDISDAVLLADALTRCSGDEFLERICDRFNPPGGKRTFRHCAEVDSKQDQYQLVQVCDLLLGLRSQQPQAGEQKNEKRDSPLSVREAGREKLLVYDLEGRPFEESEGGMPKIQRVVLERKKGAQVICPSKR